MRRIVVQSYMTLDGVVQSGGDPDEDRDGGFARGGWMSAYNAQNDTLGEFGEIVGAWEHKAEALLLGRKTYAIFAGSWGTWDENVEGMQGDKAVQPHPQVRCVAHADRGRLAERAAARP